MKIKKVCSILCAVGLAVMNCLAISASAVDANPSASTKIIVDNTDTAGLIAYYSLSITSAVKAVKITAVTSATDTMAKIGFTDIQIQHSSNGSTGWVTENTPFNKTVTDTNYYSLDGFSVGVSGGYYYRVVLDHYAKEQGWFFPSSQSISNTSNVVWVPAS